MQSIKRFDDLSKLPSPIQVLPVVSRTQLVKMPVVLSTAHPHNRLA